MNSDKRKRTNKSSKLTSCPSWGGTVLENRLLSIRLKIQFSFFKIRARANLNKLRSTSQKRKWDWWGRVNVAIYIYLRVVMFPKKLGIDPDNLFTVSALQGIVHSVNPIKIICRLTLRMKCRSISQKF